MKRSVKFSVMLGVAMMLPACDARGPVGARSFGVAAPVVRDPVVSSPAAETVFDSDEATAFQEGAGTDDCSKWIVRVNGERFCLDEVLAILVDLYPADNDGDGVPNIGDDDIDGDGIPNGDDLDVDGDGIPNSEDDDIDDDGVPNEHDVDIDGDFLRNRWDPDMDGDLLYNPHDLDADADGKLKFAELEGIESPCGAAEIFRDPGDCGLDECDDSDDDSEGSESDCDDKGPDDGDGRNKPMDDSDADPDSASPSENELAIFGDNIERLFDDDADLVEELAEADPDSTIEEILDAAMDIIEAAIAEDTADASGAAVEALDDTAVAEYADRRRSVRELTGAVGLSLVRAKEVARLISAGAKRLSATTDQLRETLFAADEHVPGKDIMEDGALAARLHEISDDAELDPSEVASALGPAARTAQLIGDDTDTESVWERVVERSAEHEDDSGGKQFSLVAVAQTAEGISLSLEEPDIDSVDDSLDNLLDAAAELGLTDPLPVLSAIVELSESDPNVSIADGISDAEAMQGAMEAAS